MKEFSKILLLIITLFISTNSTIPELLKPNIIRDVSSQLLNIAKIKKDIIS